MRCQHIDDHKLKSRPPEMIIINKNHWSVTSKMLPFTLDVREPGTKNFMTTREYIPETIQNT